MRAHLISAGLLLLMGAAHAQEDLLIDQTSIYVTDPLACEALETKGLDAWMDMDFLSLSFADGIQSMEFHCDFYDIKSRANSPTLFVDAVCQMPGELYPDIMAIAPNGEDSILVVSGSETTLALASSDAPPSDNPPGTTLYHRCGDLTEIPVTGSAK